MPRRRRDPLAEANNEIRRLKNVHESQVGPLRLRIAKHEADNAKLRRILERTQVRLSTLEFLLRMAADAAANAILEVVPVIHDTLASSKE